MMTLGLCIGLRVGARGGEPDSGGSAPVNITPPVITSNATLASPVVGDVLTVSTPGTYSGSPSPTLSYQWKRANIGDNAMGAGAMTSAYTADVSDNGCTLQCDEIAANTAGSTAAESNVSGTVTLGASFTYLQPGGSFTYIRPSGGQYLRP